jgi:hypothetical protein
MKEDIVSHNIAVKLSEKGFDYKTTYSYNEEQIINPLVIEQYGGLSDDGYYELTKDGGGDLEWDFVYIYSNELVKTDRIYVNRNTVSAPTMYQVAKWLRTEHNIEVVPMPLNKSTLLIGGEKYVLYLFKDGERIIQNTNKVCFITYEETLINGIKYVIDNVL